MIWDERFIGLARLVAGWSKDPSTKTGCVIVRPDRTVASLGYNGLPRGVEDDPERLDDRPTKYAMTVHAEINAIVGAREVLHGCTAFVHPWPPCAPCTAAVIQAGIVRIVAPPATPEQHERWGESFAHSRAMLDEAGVALELRVVPNESHEAR
jgi:dCMP deaminase